MRTVLLAAGWLGALVMGIFMFSLVAPAVVHGACEPEPITEYTPTGIAGCERWGRGIASHYGPGNGVATNACTWERRHSSGCGSIQITSIDTGRTVIAPVIDFCDCYTGTDRERIVDLQYGVVSALGLDLSRGLYPVLVEPVGKQSIQRETARSSSPALPDTSIGEDG